MKGMKGLSKGNPKRPMPATHNTGATVGSITGPGMQETKNVMSQKTMKGGKRK
jgi:hypothetical protein